jgi:dCMP deaminase
MRIAAVVSLRGTCERASVGSVIARDGRVISTGYVGAPAGLPHCISVGCEIGSHNGCTRTVHAEANAIAVAARFGTSTDKAELYCTHSPCLPCAKLIINAGITRFIYEQPYRDPSGLALLEEAGLTVTQMIFIDHEEHLKMINEGLSPAETDHRNREGWWPETPNDIKSN